MWSLKIVLGLSTAHPCKVETLFMYDSVQLVQMYGVAGFCAIGVVDKGNTCWTNLHITYGLGSALLKTSMLEEFAHSVWPGFPLSK